METNTGPTQPKGVILLCQQGYFPIEETAILAALPAPLHHLPRHRILLDVSGEVAFSKYNHDWYGAGALLHNDFREKIKPVLDAHPDYAIAYFGTVPISLAAQFGYLLGTWRKVFVFQHHHIRKDWKWKCIPSEDKIRILVSGLPQEGSQAAGYAVIRVSTSHLIDPSLTRKIVAHPLVDIDLRTEILNEDVLAAPGDLDLVAGKFKEIIDTVHRLYPHLSMIHLFAACPVGLAMLLGKQVGARIHQSVHTYEFDSKTDPQYNPSLILQEDPEPAFVPTASERVAAQAERFMWAEELARIQEFARSLPNTEPDGWLADVLPFQVRGSFSGKWRSMARISTLRSLCNSRIDLTVSSAADGFRYQGNSASWNLADEFLIPVMRQLPNVQDRRRAARLFFFHEGLHESQTLTSSTSPDIGRFPKVLEEIDYRADVWAFLYERSLSKWAEPNEDVDSSQFLQSLIHLHTEIMVSFDIGPHPLTRIQTRRVARYLIWAWQYLMAERYQADGSAWSTLAEKPLLELFGPRILTARNRIFYLLDSRFSNPLEMGVYSDERLYRIGQSPSAPIEKIIAALRTLNGEGLRDALRGIFDQTIHDR